MLRVFGARIGPRCHIYPGAIIWAPWNLICGAGVCIASGAEIYNQAPITLGDYAVISQGAYLCAGSHEYRDEKFPLFAAPIRIGTRAWIAARAIVLLGVTVGEGCVVGAGSVVARDLPAWSVCAGNPCRVVRQDAARGGSPLPAEE